MSDTETRFAFGKNWAAFIKLLDEDRVEKARESLAELLPDSDLAGKKFLDVGSGSGLMSLAARRLGASVVSFDYDEDSVGCTQHLHEHFDNSSENWRVMQGSALDDDFMEKLGTFDVAYSWGVLHHTGHMWKGIELTCQRVAEGGVLFIAIYNDQGAWSGRWAKIKKAYCSNRLARWAIIGTFIPYWIARNLLADLVWMRNPIARYRDYGEQRGMSVFYDWFDWLGGFPFEVAKPEEIIDYCQGKGFRLVGLKTAGGSVGCNEFVFTRENA